MVTKNAKRRFGDADDLVLVPPILPGLLTSQGSPSTAFATSLLNRS